MIISLILIYVLHALLFKYISEDFSLLRHMGKIQKGIICSVDNCNDSAIRSKSKKSIDSDILSISSEI